ncbi:hypothetical protein E2562_023493 [Oryza meyeriana var. granulata]|uniref:Uncharacterized protein n=1 Tax=Oryza meyeriana var. granulata TaxID=110450 RepID=A0A6G1BZ66_9ORYZ|nr:hypothetical protein E2562_023493 [Oryza meyeriana var. granulata]
MAVVRLHKAAVAVVRLDQAAAPAACPKPPAACPNMAATPAAHHNPAGAGRNPPARVFPTRDISRTTAVREAGQALKTERKGSRVRGGENYGARGTDFWRAREPFPDQPRGIPLEETEVVQRSSRRRRGLGFNIETQLSA